MAPIQCSDASFRARPCAPRSAWVGPPDSLGLGCAGPFNGGAGAGVVLGDSTAWADPEKNFRSLVPAVRMLWAGLGIARPPAPGAAVFGARTEGADSGVRIWRFAQGEDTLDYRVVTGRARLFEAEWRRQGKVVARSPAELDGRATPAPAPPALPAAPPPFSFPL